MNTKNQERNTPVGRESACKESRSDPSQQLLVVLLAMEGSAQPVKLARENAMQGLSHSSRRHASCHACLYSGLLAKVVFLPVGGTWPSGILS